MSNRALIIVDIQNEYFPEGNLPLVGIHEATEKAAKVLAHARQNNDLVIHVRHEFTDPNTPFFKAGTNGVKIHPQVAPLDSETVILKNYPNSFLKTNLKEELDKSDIEEVVIIGSMSHMCIDATTRAASDFGYKATVVHDACATRDLEFRGNLVPANHVHTAMMAALEFAYATIKTTDEYIKR